MSHGVVLRRDGEIGEIAEAGQILFRVGIPKPLQVVAEVNEEDIPRVKIGQVVLFRTDAFPNQRLEGTVREITPMGDVAAKTFRIKVALPDDTPLKPGMSVEANIITREKPNALLIPADAVQGDAVFVVDGNHVRKRDGRERHPRHAPGRGALRSERGRGGCFAGADRDLPTLHVRDDPHPDRFAIRSIAPPTPSCWAIGWPRRSAHASAPISRCRPAKARASIPRWSASSTRACARSTKRPPMCSPRPDRSSPSRPASINELRVHVNNPLAAREVAARIENDTGYKSVSWQEANEDLLSTFIIRNIIMYAVVGAILLVASFGTYNIISTITHEKARDIAIMKSLGLSEHIVRSIFVVEALIIGLAGALAGFALGYLLSRGARRRSASPIRSSIPTTCRWPIDPLHYLLAGMVALVSSVTAGYQPASKAARGNPVDIIRGADMSNAVQMAATGSAAAADRGAQRHTYPARHRANHAGARH